MDHRAEVFELTIPVEPGDIDESGHANNVVYLRWVQEVAVAHWRHAALPEDQAALRWVVVRHEIDYREPALPGDRIVARTWVGSASRVRFERHTELRRERDHALLARARTLWCPLDSRSGKPSAVSPAVRERFSAPAAGYNQPTMRVFDHVGIPTAAPQPAEMYVEATKVWVTDPSVHPQRIEFLRFEADTPVEEPLRSMPHIAFQVDDLETAIEGAEILLGPFAPTDTLRVVFVRKDGAIYEFMENRGPSRRWFRDQ